jgi:hypothetical protein
VSDEEVPAQNSGDAIKMFTPRDIRLMGYVALGWITAEINRRMHTSKSTAEVNTLLELLDVKGRHGLAIYYVDHVLPYDVVSGYATPGEKLKVWRENAEKRRKQLLASSSLSQVHYRSLMVQATPENAEKSDEDLAALAGVTATSFGLHINAVSSELLAIQREDRALRFAAGGMVTPLSHGRTRALVIARLAPFPV